MTKKTTKNPVEIKMATIMAVSAILHSADTGTIDKALKATTGGTSDFFDGEFVIIDVGSLKDDAQTLDWPAVIPLFRKYNLNPVAVRNAPAELAAVIAAHGLSIDAMQVQPLSQAKTKAVAEPVIETAAPAALSPKTMIIDTPVRGGQRVYARDCDMVVTAVVNSGAEIIADGSIYMYAPLRGRALAGARGDTSAQIFTTSMEAELVSVAGMYRTFDDGVPREVKGKPAKIVLQGETLALLPLDITSRL